MQAFEMPRPTEPHRKLEKLAGEWIGEETMHPSPWDPKGGKAKSRTKSRMDLDGFYLVCDYVQERDGKVTYRGHGLIGYDPAQQRYLMHWFDSMGFPCTSPAQGKWEGNQLMFEQSGPMGTHRSVYTFEADGRYGFRIENSADGGKWTVFIEGTYKRA